MSMASAPLSEWESKRRGRFNELLDAHKEMGGEGRGRRWRTEQVNWALVVRLTGEFQGYSRDLHDEAAYALALRAAGGNQQLELVIATTLKADRKRSRGNPTPDALGRDFSRFGMELWPSLKAEDIRNEIHEKRLRALVEARNAFPIPMPDHSPGWLRRVIRSTSRPYDTGSRRYRPRP